MSALLQPLVRPALPARRGAFARWLGALLGGIARHAARRDAIAWLRELDDVALADIGIERGEIERAVHGLVRPASPLTRGDGQRIAPWN